MTPTMLFPCNCYLSLLTVVCFYTAYFLTVSLTLQGNLLIPVQTDTVSETLPTLALQPTY